MFNSSRPPGTTRISTHTIHQSETQQKRPNTNLYDAVQPAPTFSVGRTAPVSRETKSQEGTPSGSTPLPGTIGDSEKQASVTTVSFTTSPDRILSDPRAGVRIASSHLPDTTSSHATGTRRVPSEVLSGQRVVIPTRQANQPGGQPGKQPGKQATATVLPQDINSFKTLSHPHLPVASDSSVIYLHSQSIISYTDRSTSPSSQLSIIAHTLKLAPDETHTPTSQNLQLAR